MQNSHLKNITLGIMLLIASWAVKQVFISFAIYGGAGALEAEVLNMSFQAEVAEATRDERLKKAELNHDINENREKIDRIRDNDDLSFEERSERTDKLDEKNNLLREKQMALYEKMEKIEADLEDEGNLIEERVDARIDSHVSGASGLSMAQWFLRLKMLLDLVKIAAVFLMIKGALGLVGDPQADNTTRWFAIGTTVVVLFSILVTGIISFFA